MTLTFPKEKPYECKKIFVQSLKHYTIRKINGNHFPDYLRYTCVKIRYPRYLPATY